MGRGAAGDPPRRAAARAPGRHLPVHARGHVRRRPRPDRLRGALRPDEGEARDLRDLLELRRGRAPLRARARRHARGAPQARRAVRPHRPRASLRAAAVRDRRPLGPRADAGRDVQAAERLRPRRARRALARRRRGHRLDGGDEQQRDGRARGRRGDRDLDRRKKRAKNDASGARGRRPRLGEPRARVPDGGARADSRSRRSRPATRA